MRDGVGSQAGRRALDIFERFTKIEDVRVGIALSGDLAALSFAALVLISCHRIWEESPPHIPPVPSRTSGEVPLLPPRSLELPTYIHSNFARASARPSRTRARCAPSQNGIHNCRSGRNGAGGPREAPPPGRQADMQAEAKAKRQTAKPYARRDMLRGSRSVRACVAGRAPVGSLVG